MKKKLVFALLLIYVGTCIAVANDNIITGVCGNSSDGSNLTFTLNLLDSTLTIEGSGEMKDYGTTPWEDHKSKIKTIIFPEGLTNIGTYAFNYCPNLHAISIPNTITKIGQYAFQNSGLTTLHIPATVKTIGAHAFEGDTLLTTVILDNGVKTINDYAFQSCTKLTSAIIPTSVTTFGVTIFNSCPQLPAIYNSTTFIYLPRHYTEYTIPDGITTIARGAFKYCKQLISVTLPATLQTIGIAAFYECVALHSIKLPASVTEIGKEAFGSSNITSIFFDESSTGINIGDQAFLHCNKLYSIVLPSNCTLGNNLFESDTSLVSVTIGEKNTIGDYLFLNCTKLTDVIVPTSVTTFGNDIFKGCTAVPILMNDSLFLHCPRDCTICTIPQGIKGIARCAFRESKIQNVSIPNTVRTIGRAAFYLCDSLKTIVLPNSVKIIEMYGLESCHNLEHVDLGDSLIEIGQGALAYNYKLQHITFPATLTTIGKNAFQYSGLQTIHLHKGITTCDYAFYQDTALTSVTFEDGYNFIGDYMFGNCNKLQHIDFPSSLMTIGQYAFQYSGLKTAHIPACVTTCDAAFYQDTALISVTFEDGYKSVGKYMFRECINLDTITFPLSLTSINSYAFLKCQKIRYFTIPQNVSTIKGGALSTAYTLLNGTSGYKIGGSLRHIFVDVQNEHFISIDGILYSKDTTTIVAYPSAKIDSAFYIPKTIKKIQEYAFFGSELKTLILSPTITTIEYGGIEQCYQLEHLHLSENLTSIGKEGILRAYKLKSISIPASVTKMGDYILWASTGYAFFKGNYATAGGLNTAHTINICAQEYLTQFSKYATFHTSLDGTYNDTIKYKTEVTDQQVCHTITCNGPLTDVQTYPWDDWAFEINKVSLAQGVTSNVPCLYYDMPYLNEIVLPKSMNTFYCTSLDSTYLGDFTCRCLPVDVPDYTGFHFAYFDTCTLYIPIGATAIYKSAPYWKEFKHIVEREYTVEITDLTETSARITWDKVPTATHYSLTVTDSAEFSHTYIIDSVGNILNSKATTPRKIVMKIDSVGKSTETLTINITGLQPATTYTYKVSAYTCKSPLPSSPSIVDLPDPIYSTVGNFITLSLTALLEIGNNNDVYKHISNGVPYNLLGQPVGKGYKGIVIKNGEKYLQ